MGCGDWLGGLGVGLNGGFTALEGSGIAVLRWAARLGFFFFVLLIKEIEWVYLEEIRFRDLENSRGK